MDWNYMDTQRGIERVSRPDWKMPEMPLVWRGDLESEVPPPANRITQVSTEGHGSPFAGFTVAAALWVLFGLAAACVRGCS